jgi:CarD family transcriptional regulator
MFANDLRLLVPVDKADEIGLKAAPFGEDVEEVFSVLSGDPELLPANSKERAAVIDRALRTGKPLRLARAFRDLAWRGHRDRLLAVDGRQLKRVRLFLGGEVARARGIGLEEAERLIERTVEGSLRWAASVEGERGRCLR